MEYKKAQPVKLREAGKDEKWLQELINSDPTVIGLGELVVIERERQQSSGGRLDFLMYDPEEPIRYEMEVMLGTLNESHIIRTIEYWDIERRRFPNYEHRAVIVAEDITNRFFNIISLMNKSIPIIAIQMNALKLDNQLLLNFVKVLDLADTGDDDEQEIQEGTDRKYWDARSDPKSMELFDALVGSVRTIDAPKLSYNKGHIAIETSGQQFMWCYPRKSQFIFFVIRIGDERDSYMAKFEEQGIECNKAINPRRMKIKVTKKEFEENKDLFLEAVKVAEASSH